MSSQRTVKSIVSAIQKLYPRELADGSWDNTGLLLGAPLADSEVKSPRNVSVLLAIDLTAGVAQEAIDKKQSLVVAYHPIIFRGLKSLTTNDTQQSSLLRLARAGISVYSPHTACDAAVGGVNDWLLDGITGGRSNEEWRKVVKPVVPSVDGFEDAGMGRVAQLKTPITFEQLLQLTKTHLDLSHVQAAISPYHTGPISKIAVCAGSGASVLQGVEADVYVTGEMSHHDALALVENGINAVTCGHSNTERGFLNTFKHQLENQLKQDPDFDHVDVSVSTTDKDPFVTM